ncbi:MAG: hypothetical protein U0791_23080 [Gemmataceae bacterium]
MTLLANDSFWAIRSINDLVSLVGFLLAIISIWFSWWLAKRDLEKRISHSQRVQYLRLQLVMIRADLSRIHWLLREGRQACQAADLVRGLDRCEWAQYFMGQLRIDEAASTDLLELMHKLQTTFG